MKQKYNIIYSLGRDCACAMYMKKAHLRSCSGPFDWLTNADFKTRFDLMTHDFDGFLDVDCLKKMEKPTAFPADKNNDYYENIKTGLYFWHDFPADMSFDKAYPRVKKKYDRRIRRFYETVRKGEKVLLIWFSHVDNTPDKVVLECCHRFCGKIGKTIDFLIVEHTEGVEKPQCRNIAPNITRYNLHTQKFDENGVPQTLGNEASVQPIFNQYQLIVPFVSKCEKCVLKFIRPFVPVKKWRKAIKRRIV